MQHRKHCSRSFTALAMSVALLGASFAATAGGPPPPPPPPWKPTNTKTLLFVVDASVQKQLGCSGYKACMAAVRQMLCGHHDYLHGMIEGASANLRLDGTFLLVDKVIKPSEFRTVLAPYRSMYGTDYAMLVTALKSGVNNDIVGEAEKWGHLAWYSTQGNARQHFAHEFAHLQGAGHRREEQNLPTWAVGYKRNPWHGTLMRNDVPRADLYSDHEKSGWGDAHHSVARLLRETNGRYTRWQGVIAAPLR